MRAVLLFTCLLLAGAASAGVRPPAASVPARVAMPGMKAAQLRDLKPLFDLLITLRLLTETPAPPGDGAALRAVLSPLAQASTLTPAQAGQVLAQLQAALSESARLDLAAARAALERRADLRLAQARFAEAGDQAPNPTFNRLALTVPGGAALIARLAAQPGLNPYLGAPNADLLRRLLAQLR